jgi:hypothetical protein
VSGTWSSGANTSLVLRLVTDGTPNGPSWFDDLSIAPVGPPPPQNLVPNPSFETADASSADAASWTEGTGHTRSADRSKSGAWAMKADLAGAANAASRATLTVTPNTTYLLWFDDLSLVPQ